MRPTIAYIAESGRVLAAWAALLVLEHFMIATFHSRELAGGWELGVARSFLTPIVLGMLTPVAFFAVQAGRIAWPRRAIGGVGAAFGVVVGYGVTFGRHFANWALRAPFIAVVAVAGAGGALAVHTLLKRWSPTNRVWVGGAGCVFFWLADATILPRLYPAFHNAVFALALASAAIAALSLPKRGDAAFAAATLVGALSGIALFEWAATKVRSADNLRLVLVEHAPLMGRAVRIAAHIAPPPPIEESSTSAATLRIDPTRSLDWTGRDIVLITIDALRADHVSSYGYSRPTTPNIDALAKNGARFDDAYCPTPHTSYSVTSLLTGKYMRPLLSAGIGEDSETWAGYLRRYGYRTAAFYPPAVFFIDEQKFRAFQTRGLDFEYRKEEFADPKLRSSQVRAYIANVPKGLPLFLWVHVFEPHEPYVNHADHPFGDPSHPTDIDAYDSEIAASDALVGEIVSEVRASRPSTVFVITADHGEEFNDHGGRYHGTTVYEEQVRVPLVIQGEGIAAQTVSHPVQTIDLLSTTLSALGVPRPPRIVGRDLGPTLARKVEGAETKGFAYAETDDYSLVAEGAERLICQRKIGACALYDVSKDRIERADIGPQRPGRVKELRALLGRTERENGKFEKGEILPEAIRRAFNRERDAAPDAAALLDDANPLIRRKAAEGVLRLMTPEAATELETTVAQVERACGREEDHDTRVWCSLALVRAGKRTPTPAERDAWLHDPNTSRADAAALVFAERGDQKAIDPLVTAWKRAPHDLDEARDYFRAFEVLKSKEFVSVLVPMLEDVRLRPYAFGTLAVIGDKSVRAQLLATFATERYVTSRAREANALIALGATSELRDPLTRFAGMPEPFEGVLGAAVAAKVIPGDRSSCVYSVPTEAVTLTIPVRAAGLYRLLVRVTESSAKVDISFDDGPPKAGEGGGREKWATADLPPGPHAFAASVKNGKIEAIWLVPVVPEIPPPPPKAWDAGVTDPRGIEGP